MDDLISRKALRDHLYAMYRTAEQYPGLRVDEHLIVLTIDNQPTIDRERHGWWIKHREYDNDYDTCSVCRHEYGLGYAYSLDYKYCPACGALMDAKEDDE